MTEWIRASDDRLDLRDFYDTLFTNAYTEKFLADYQSHRDAYPEQYEAKPCTPVACQPWQEAEVKVTHIFEHCDDCNGTGSAGYGVCDACGGYGAIKVPV